MITLKKAFPESTLPELKARLKALESDPKQNKPTCRELSYFYNGELYIFLKELVDKLVRSFKYLV